MSDSANSVQHGGDHYKSVVGTQHWDLMADYNVPYLEGNSSKYGYRWPKKNGVEDVLKFQHYVQKVREKHNGEGYQNTSIMPKNVWIDFCNANGVGSASQAATWAALNWRNDRDLQLALTLIDTVLTEAKRLQSATDSLVY